MEKNTEGWSLLSKDRLVEDLKEVFSISKRLRPITKIKIVYLVKHL